MYNVSISVAFSYIRYVAEKGSAMQSSKKRLIIRAVVVVAGVCLGMAGVVAWAYGAHIRDKNKIIPDYLRTHAVKKLQIGAGIAGTQGFADWLNTDIEPFDGEAYLDATKRFPLPDQTLSYVFAEHVIEHLSYKDGLGMLRESYRTLKPGGKVRIATPNLLKLVQLFQDAKTDEMRNYIEGKFKAKYWVEPLPLTLSPECVILNYEMRTFGHEFIYDSRTLADSMKRVGFESIQEFVSGESDDPQLAGLEVRHTWKDHAASDYETMVIQAVRPF
jgi:predicted SAM-dependent methyltransferase